jgi:hypothetical protein
LGRIRDIRKRRNIPEALEDGADEADDVMSLPEPADET